MVHSFLGPLAGYLVLLTEEGGQLQGTQVMGQQDLRKGAHEGLPPSRPM